MDQFLLAIAGGLCTSVECSSFVAFRRAWLESDSDGDPRTPVLVDWVMNIRHLYEDVKEQKEWACAKVSSSAKQVTNDLLELKALLNWRYLKLSYVGKIRHAFSAGHLEGCKLIRKDKSSYGFVNFFERRSVALAIVTLNGRQLFGQPIKVKWAYASAQREDTSNHYNIFVGGLSPEVTDATLFACFSVYPSCSDARVMWDQKTGRSRGFGFVSVRSQQEAQSAINDLNASLNYKRVGAVAQNFAGRDFATRNHWLEDGILLQGVLVQKIKQQF